MLPEKKQSMCRATMGKLTFENIKKQLKAIHECTGMNVATGTSNTSSVTVKKEPVFEAECSERESFIHDPTGLEEVDVGLEDHFEERLEEVIEVLVQLAERNQ